MERVATPVALQVGERKQGVKRGKWIAAANDGDVNDVTMKMIVVMMKWCCEDHEVDKGGSDNDDDNDE